MASENIAVGRQSDFLRACRAEPVERLPVWILRQAGRYLPGYRAIRQKHSFLEVCKTPELAVAVSLEPYHTLGVDAVIVFSDILIPAEAMGLALEIGDAGPLLRDPVDGGAAVEKLRAFDPAAETRFVLDAIAALCRELGPDVPVIGFAAAPWTLACYLVEGKVSPSLARVKGMMYSAPALFRRLLEKIAGITASYLKAQAQAGAAALQIFDTWAGELSARDYTAFALPATRVLLERLGQFGAPVVLYSKGTRHILDKVAQAGAHVLSVDWRVDLGEARGELGSHLPLQGNLDPAVLLGPPEGIRAAVREAVEKTAGIGHILNLGHGILPETPVEHAQEFVRAGHEAPLGTGRRLGRAP